MAAGDTLITFTPLNNLAPDWLWVAFTSGSTEPSLGAAIHDDVTAGEAVLEFISLESGAWSGTAAGYMLLSGFNGTAFTSGGNFSSPTDDAGNDGTLTLLPVSAFATLDTRNDNLVLDFDDTTNEVAMFQGFMPEHYGGNGVTLRIGVMATDLTVTPHDVSVFAFFKSVTDNVDDLDTKNFAVPQSNTAVDEAAASGRVRYFTIAFTNGAQMDSVAAGEMFYLLIMRDAQDATNDDLTDDMELVFVEVRETP